MGASKPMLLCGVAVAVAFFSVVPGYALAAQSAQAGSTRALREKQEQLFALTNQARAAAGVGPVKWDPALAAAALNHCMRMAGEGPIAHRYGGESDLAERAAQTGAHFSLIEENIAVGSYTASIQQGWMESRDHRANLLSPDVDSVGIAVVAGGGVLYAVADFARTVPSLTTTQAETAVARLLRARGLEVLSDAAGARATCARDRGLPSSLSGPQPRFVMRWQDADLSRLPQGLLDKIASGEYRRAAVGSCPAQNVDGGFTVYRMAVLLFGPPGTNELKSYY